MDTESSHSTDRLSADADADSDGSPRPATDGRNASPSDQRLRFIVLGILFLLVGLPLAWRLGRSELAAWRMAQALEAELNDDLATARKWADRAVEVLPESPKFLVLRAQLLNHALQPELAIRDCDHALTVIPEHREALQTRAFANQMLGRHEQAIADWQQILAQDRRPIDAGVKAPHALIAYATSLNALAYARALGDQQLDQALSDVETALSMLGDDAAMLDTRGYLHYLQDHYEQARRDMEKAVEMAETQRLRGKQTVKAEERLLVDSRSVRQQIEALDQNLAVIYHHRALVYAKLGLDNQARQDFERAQQWGYDPAAGVF